MRNTPSRIVYGHNEPDSCRLINTLQQLSLDQGQTCSSDPGDSATSSTTFCAEDCSLCVEALYSALPSQATGDCTIDFNHLRRTLHTGHVGLDEGDHNSSSESADYEDIDSSEDHRDAQSEEFDGDIDTNDHEDFISFPEAIPMEMKRDQHFRWRGLGVSQSVDDKSRESQVDADPTDSTASTTQRCHDATRSSAPINIGSRLECTVCTDPKPMLCLDNRGWIWRPLIIEALATAAATIANLYALQHHSDGAGSLSQNSFRHGDFLPKRKWSLVTQDPATQQDSTRSNYAREDRASLTIDSDIVTGICPLPNKVGPIRHFYQDSSPTHLAVYHPLPPNSPYRFRQKTSEFLEPVGELHEFQSAERSSRQVLLHVWPPSSSDMSLLQKLEACCRDFQENDIVRGHSGDGFLSGWRPSWKQPEQTGILRFGHWRVRAPAGQGTHLYPPFQTPLTLAAGGGSVLKSTRPMKGSSADDSLSKGMLSNPDGILSTHNPKHQHHHPVQHCQSIQHSHSKQHPCAGHHADEFSKNTQVIPPESQPNCHRYSRGCEHAHLGPLDSIQCRRSPGLRGLLQDPTTQGRLLRLIRAIQLVEKNIVARRLKYLFPTLYEKYHGLQFGTPRLFDAVGTVALAMDVSPRLHRDRGHTKHGFCWIVACGDFVGGDLCIPELGKRVVMRPGTVVAIRSTVVAYYIERYAKNTSMYTMYGYTSDNNWPPAA